VCVMATRRSPPGSGKEESRCRRTSLDSLLWSRASVEDGVTPTGMSEREDDLAEHLTGSHLLESVTRVGQCVRRVDHRRNPLVDNEVRQSLKLGPSAHCGPDNTQLPEEDLGQLGLGRRVT